MISCPRAQGASQPGEGRIGEQGQTDLVGDGEDLLDVLLHYRPVVGADGREQSVRNRVGREVGNPPSLCETSHAVVRARRFCRPRQPSQRCL